MLTIKALKCLIIQVLLSIVKTENPGGDPVS